MNEITVTELKALMDSNQTPIMIDVREAFEREVSHIGGFHIPLQSLPTEIYTLNLPEDTEIVVYCRSGARSANATAFLLQLGYSRAKNMKGGMKAWKTEIDPNIEVA